jgi:hypothetical protein
MDDYEKYQESRAEALATYREWISTPEGKAQEKLFGGLMDLRNDPEIGASSLCCSFLDLIISISPNPGAEKMSELVEPLTPHFKQAEAKRNAVIRHINNNKARDFIVSEWAKYQKDYQNNKSAFARDYVRRISHELDVTVTEKQMREVWLKDTPPASKPAG